MRDYDEAVRLAPKDPVAFYNRGKALWEHGQFTNGMSDLEKAIHLAPEVADYPYVLAWALATCPTREARNGKRALVLATKACELSKWRDAAHLETLAAAYAECGKLPDAIKWQKKAIQISYAEKDLQQDARNRLELYQMFGTKVMPARAGVALVNLVGDENLGTEEDWLIGVVRN